MNNTNKSIIINDNLIKLKVSKLRNVNTGFADFNKNVVEISSLLMAHISPEIQLKETTIDTPNEKTTGYELKYPIILVPILRAGLGMLEGARSIIPNSRVGFIGVQRNEETLNPEYYYDKLPKVDKNATVIILDPMLATGGSAVFAIEKVKELGYKNISICAIISAQVGIDRIFKDHPEVTVYSAVLDRQLNDIGYICPGLGDAGDRIFGTDNYDN